METVDYQSLKVRIASRHDADKINQLRVTAYQNATGSVLQHYDFLLWNETDDRSLVIYLEDSGGRALSSIRAQTIGCGTEIESLFDIRLKQALPLPLMAIDKLVTLREYRRLGLSTFSRYLCTKAAKTAGMGCIGLTINDNASRVPLLRDMGYQFELADISHRCDSAFKNDCAVLLGVLPQAAYEQAIVVARQGLPCDIDKLDFESNFEEQVKTKLNCF